jgi:hypothetical protein
MFDCARRKVPVPALARWLLGLGITATLAANVAHGLGHGLTGAAVAAWPAVALVGSCELLMMIIRSAGCREPGRPWAGSLSACRIPIRRRCGRRRHSRSSLRPGACRRCARSAPGCMRGSRGPGGYALTWPRSTARRRARPSDIGLRSLRFSRLPDATGDRQRKISADIGGNMVRARLPGMASERAIWAGETIGRRSSLPGNWPEEGMLPVVLVTGSGRPAARRAAVPALCPRARNGLRRLAAIKAPGSAVDLDPGGSCTVVTAGHPPGSRELSWA